MPNWVPALPIDACPAGSAVELVIGERIVALFHVGERFYAIDGVCPHQGGPLGKGHVAGCIVTCPWHGWQFDVASGRHLLNSTIVQTRFPTRIQDATIWIDIGGTPSV